MIQNWHMNIPEENCVFAMCPICSFLFTTISKGRGLCFPIFEYGGAREGTAFDNGVGRSF
jgi:hypothetical protein